MFPRSHNIIGRWVPSAGATGYRLIDRSGRSNHGTLTNMDPASDWVVSGGKLALDCDGVNDHVLTTALGPVTTQRSTSVWFNCSSTFASGVFGGLVGFGGSGGVLGSMFLVSFGSDANFTTNGFGVTQYGDAVGVGGYNDGKWHHGVVVNSGSLWQVYVDGILRASKTMLTAPATSAVYLGRFAPNPFGTAYYPGKLDDVSVFNVALTANEVAQIYRLGRGYGVYPDFEFDDANILGPAFRPYWASRRSQLIGGGI